MSDFLNDYKAYYKARAKRYERDIDYPLTAKAEADLCNAMVSCNDLPEFRNKLGNLNDLVAVALTKDKYSIRYAHYLEIEEKIRALGPQRIIEKSDGKNNVMDLITMVNEEENINMVEIAMDDISPFSGHWFLLERVEAYERAEVPDKWKKDMEEFAEDGRKSMREGLTSTETEMNKWKVGWRFNPLLVSEERHRRKLPFPDTEIDKRLQQYNTINHR